MKKLLAIALFLSVAVGIQAQVETPQPSPLSKVEQKVGLTDVTIEYSRPGVKGRTIFGDLEPFGGIWRTGANKNTIITFSDDINFDGTEVKAGSYAIFTKLINAESWEIMLYSDTSNWGTPSEEKWDDTKVVAKAKVDVMPVPFNVETFTIDINQITNKGAVLEMIWEKSYVGVPFTVPTDVKVDASIKKTLSAEAPTHGDYFEAAKYYLAEDKDIKKAVMWIDKACEMTKEEPKFWYLRQQALIHHKAGNKEKAIAAAKASLEGAKKANYVSYIKMNTESLKEWGAM